MERQKLLDWMGLAGQAVVLRVPVMEMSNMRGYTDTKSYKFSPKGFAFMEGPPPLGPSRLTFWPSKGLWNHF